jgi:hypothetical protein
VKILTRQNFLNNLQLASEEDDLELIDERWCTMFIAEDKL